jgi:hypothetical protein
MLARQMLLEPVSTTIPRVLERMGGLQAQYAPSMYIGLWTRKVGFERDQLDRALRRRVVVQGTLMRETIHLVSKRDYWPMAVAVRRARREWWVRVAAGHDPRGMERAAERLRARLAEGPVARAELEGIVGKGHVAGIGLWLDLVRVPPSGTWERRRADLFGSAEHWIGAPREPLSEAEAMAHLVRRYLAGFGPASIKSIAGFTGIRLTELGPAFELLSLRRFRDEDGHELLDLPRAPLPPADTPATVRFLPIWDAMLLVHARRTGVLPEKYRPLVFNSRTPQSVATFLVEGAVAGTWRYEGGRIRIEPFERLARTASRALAEEAERLAELHR